MKPASPEWTPSPKFKHISSPRHIALIERCYDAIVAKGIAAHEALPLLIAPAKRRGRPKRRVGHNLLLRLRDFKPDVLRFLTDIRSVISTARKQGWILLDTLMGQPAKLIGQLRPD